MKPEYLHVLLNPLPVYGLACGVFALIVALCLKSRPAQLVGLLLIFLAASSAWPVIEYGEHGYNRVYAMSYKEGQQLLDTHAARAARFQSVFYVTAGLAVAALLSQKFFTKLCTLFTVLTLVAAILALVAGAYISRAGGQVRHSEFRPD